MPERLKYRKCMNLSLSGIDLKLLFIVTEAYFESGLFSLKTENKFLFCKIILVDYSWSAKILFEEKSRFSLL